MNRLFGTKSTAPKPTLDSAISNVSPLHFASSPFRNFTPTIPANTSDP